MREKDLLFLKRYITKVDIKTFAKSLNEKPLSKSQAAKLVEDFHKKYSNFYKKVK